MEKFYYQAKDDVQGTRICKGDTLILDVEQDPPAQPGDIVLVSVPPAGQTELRIFTSLDPSDVNILGRVTEQLIFI